MIVQSNRSLKPGCGDSTSIPEWLVIAFDMPPTPPNLQSYERISLRGEPKCPRRARARVARTWRPAHKMGVWYDDAYCNHHPKCIALKTLDGKVKLGQ
jgi:hypothetical protein